MSCKMKVDIDKDISKLKITEEYRPSPKGMEHLRKLRSKTLEYEQKIEPIEAPEWLKGNCQTVLPTWYGYGICRNGKTNQYYNVDLQKKTIKETKFDSISNDIAQLMITENEFEECIKENPKNFKFTISKNFIDLLK